MMMVEELIWNEEGGQAWAEYRGRKLKVHDDKGLRALVDGNPVWKPWAGEVFATMDEAKAAAVQAAAKT